MDRNKINEEFLAVLINNQTLKQIKIGSVAITNSLIEPLENLENLICNPLTTLDDIALFIQNNTILNELDGYYSYCVDLSKAYQGFRVKNQDTIIDIEKRKELFAQRLQLKPETYNITLDIEAFKQELNRRYILWGKAFAIRKTYQYCLKESAILAFSHRRAGWSNPKHKLTEDISIQIKTNFGYGHSSYFYTIIKYKDIIITPFSDWINYEFAKFSEIIRYSQTYTTYLFEGVFNGEYIYKPIIENEHWEDALIYARDVCNLSLSSEEAFIDKYILEECEVMVQGLEYILNSDKFEFYSINKRKHYEVDKHGHVLMEFRGEKISGSLDFIKKILQYEKIVKIKSAVERIELCNKRIQPLLEDEILLIKEDLNIFLEEMNILKPKYDKLRLKNIDYTKKKKKLQNQMIINGQIDRNNIDQEEVNQAFNKSYPEFIIFHDIFSEFRSSYKTLIQKINNLNRLSENIIGYNQKIKSYFINK